MSEPMEQPNPEFYKALPQKRRPRIALMGEFSAGKSTLANLMIGTDPLPMQVVATQLPPVWITFGDEPTKLIGLDGKEVPCDLKRVENIDPESVAFIRFQCNEEILKMCDIIDMPGISDPNMSTEVWERIIPLADAVVWCSPSTQAWRQSEAAVWDSIEDSIKQKSILLLTRADALITEKDRAKVLKRVKSETQDKFKHVLMISLLDARDAGEDETRWETSGANAFVTSFMDLLGELSGNSAEDERNTMVPDASAEGHEMPADQATDAALHATGSIKPRRPVVKTGLRAQAEPPTDPSSFTPKFS